MSNSPAAVNNEDEPAGCSPGENSLQADAGAAQPAVPGGSGYAGVEGGDTVTPPDGYPPP